MPLARNSKEPAPPPTRRDPEGRDARQLTGTAEKLPVFTGAPTWQGRLLIGIFAALWGLGGVLGIASGIQTSGTERIAPLYAGFLFLAIGLFFGGYALPGLVNSALRADNRLLLRLWPYRGNLGIGGLFVAMGLFPLLAALGVIPSDADTWPTPRWLGALASLFFVVFGLYFIAKPLLQRLSPRAQRRVDGFLPLFIVTILAILADWIAFGPGERSFSMASRNLFGTWYERGNETIGRIMFGAGGLLITIFGLIGWWRYLRDKW